MSDVYIRVKKYIEDNSLIKGDDSVLAAVSGGADSICMLFLLHQYSIENGIKMGVVCVVLLLNCPWNEDDGWAAVFVEGKLVKVDSDIVDCVYLD